MWKKKNYECLKSITNLQANQYFWPGLPILSKKYIYIYIYRMFIRFIPAWLRVSKLFSLMKILSLRNQSLGFSVKVETRKQAMFPFLFLFFLTLIPPFTHSLNQDGLFLQQFKQSLSDPIQSLSSWNDRDDTPCNWTGIKCDPVTRRVKIRSIQLLISPPWL